MTTGGPLLLEAIGAVAILVALIVRVRLSPFIALILVSLGLALAAGIPAGAIVKTFEAGVGGALGHIALVVGLGTILGKMMVESGGAERIADTVIGFFGARRADWAMMTVALIIGLPVFFEVGFVLLVPIVFTVARRLGQHPMRVGLPMAAGLSVVHAMMPPHPAAMLATQAYHADVGLTVLFALVIGIPTAAIAGPLYARLVVGRLAPSTAAVADPIDAGAARALPGFATTLLTLLLPVALMLAGSLAAAVATPGSALDGALRFVGTPVAALLIAVLVSYWTLGLARGMTIDTIQKFTNECLAPTAMITLVVGVGAGFGRILTDSGVSAAIIQAASAAHLPIVALAWLIAALMRVATGSATVAMATSAGIVAPLAAASPGIRPELLVVATGAGSVILSHVNDGGFWLVKEYFGLSVADTIRSWTVCETLISVIALALTLAVSALV
ncbi:gluconate:H+ symporter [Sphingomonas sp. NFR15]|uniref:GntT/GntP/DsdX family permease n=1 Tax=Sphingomonas sp. NFR15 TaxID=1566282 RepID=UPI000881E495|nr:gluconate:H+ symporter [Sphingomonas sp. NFR15]SDA24609.1 gluconate permease GntT (TC 2.A.8.1.4) [Sphingomonas sp. NFR15]